MSNILPLTIRTGTLPPNAAYTPQQFLDALATALQIESQEQFALFTTGALDPVYNAGPFLLNGITWRVWKNDSGAYGPLVLEQESLKYVLQQTAPDQTKYDVWIKLDGAGKAQGIFKYSGGAWKDVYEDVLSANYYTKTQVDDKVAAAIPVGTMLPFAGTAAPSGYLVCNGAAVSRTTYAALFAAIGTTYGAGDLVTSFNIPDARGRVLVGVGTGDASDATAWTLGQKRGTEGVQLTAAQNGPHGHKLFALNGTGGYDNNWGFQKAGYKISVSGGRDTGGGNTSEYVSTNQEGDKIVEESGTGAVHANIQPSLGANLIIKT